MNRAEFVNKHGIHKKFMAIPMKVSMILNELNDAGYEAYVVGGCVRDYLLNRDPDDWDITTSALPEQVKEVFAEECNEGRIIDTGIKHGTVTLLVGDEGFEITTYRIDGKYSDNRRPDSVEFTRSLRKDLARRDFTINAIAYNPEEGFVDPFDGLGDLNRELIRCVGKADERFQEDALRILRMWRFSCQLDFEIHVRTQLGAARNIHLLANIAAERKQQELVKVLNLPKCPAYDKLFNLLCIQELIPGIKDKSIVGCKHIYAELDHLWIQKDLSVKLANLLYGHTNIRKLLTELRFDNKTIDEVDKLCGSWYLEGEPDNKVNLKYALLNCGEETTRNKLLLMSTQTTSWEYLQQIYSANTMLNAIVQSHECYSLKQLAINGQDLIDAGTPESRLIGKKLNCALDAVIREKVENTKEELLAYLAAEYDIKDKIRW